MGLLLVLGHVKPSLETGDLEVPKAIAEALGLKFLSRLLVPLRRPAVRLGLPAKSPNSLCPDFPSVHVVKILFCLGMFSKVSGTDPVSCSRSLRHGSCILFLVSAGVVAAQHKEGL